MFDTTRGNGGKGGGPHPFSNAFRAPKQNSYQYNTAQKGSPLTVVYGTRRLTINVVEGFGFTSSGGGGKLGGKGGTKSGKKSGPHYSVNVALAVCQGPVSLEGASNGIDGYNRVWANGGIAAANAVNMNFYSGNDGQAPDPVFLSSSGETPVLGYSGTAYATGTPMDLGTTPALPNVQVEVTGFGAGTCSSDFPDDARPDWIVIDMTTNERYGCGFDINDLDTDGAWDAGGSIADWGRYCQASGLAMSYLMDHLEPAARWLEAIVEQTVSAVFWTGTKLKIIPYADEEIDDHGTTWTPILTARYSLTDADFIAFGGGTDPVSIDRSDNAVAPNWLDIEYESSVYNYNNDGFQVFDQAEIDLRGKVPAAPFRADGYTNVTSATAAAQLKLQRDLYVRNTYSFKLGWRYSLLELMDIVEITDVALGLSARPVRIVQIDEDDNGELTIKAEDIIAGSMAAVTRDAAAAPGFFDPTVLPGDANDPVIFEPSASFTGGVPEVCIATSGGPDWGGCEVWVSIDDATYAYIGNIYAGGRQGVLTATFPSHADPDTANTLSVDLTESRGQLLSGTADDADNAITLCYVGGELISYQNATLTSSYHYDIGTRIRRGLYNTSITSHASGTRFARIEPGAPTMLRYQYPTSFIGLPIYIKLRSFNLFYQQTQSLADVTASSYTMTGFGAVSSTVVPIQFLGIPQAAEPIVRHTFSSPVTLSAGLPGSICTAAVAATGTVTFNIALNGVNVGTMVFSGGTTAAFTMAASHTVAVGDVLTITPTTTNATLANLSGYLAGTV